MMRGKWKALFIISGVVCAVCLNALSCQAEDGNDKPAVKQCDTLAFHRMASRDNPNKMPVIFSIISIDDAIAACEKAVDFFPEHKRSKFLLARTYFIAGKHEQAKHLFKELDRENYLPAQFYITELLNGSLGFPTLSAIDIFNKYRAWCDQKIGWACSQVSSIYEKENWKGVDLSDYLVGLNHEHSYEVLAASYEKKSCDFGYIFGCAYLAESYEYGYGVDENINKANTLYAMACEENIAIACVNLGLNYDDGVGYIENSKKANELYLKGCQLQNGEGCRYLAINYKHGNGTAANAKTALSYNVKGCELNDVEACNESGEAHEEGIRTKKNYEIAFKAYSKACQMENGKSCYKVSDFLEKGLGTEKDIPKSIKFALLACEMAESGGCVRMAERYATGDGVVQDVEKAEALNKISLEILKIELEELRQ
jgi:TPR repeat protein